MFCFGFRKDQVINNPMDHYKNFFAFFLDKKKHVT